MKTAILDDYLNVALDSADWSGVDALGELRVFREPVTDEDRLADELAPFDVICAMRERTAFPASLLARLPNLKLLVTTGMGNPSIDMDAARAQGVTVCGTHGSGHATAELAFGLLLSLARDLPGQVRSVQDGGWQTRMGQDVAGARLGLLGLGRIGGRMAEYGRVFGMDVVAWSQNLTEERCAQMGVRRVEKDELFATSDYVSLHLRLSERTHHIVDADALGRMKPGARLINTSRADLVDEAALIAALREGRLAGAALDVHREEPLPADAPIRAAPNVLLTPHLGYVSDGTFATFYGETVEAVLAYAKGAPVRVLNP